MQSLRFKLIALLVAVAFGFGWAHCTLDLGCADEATASVACQLCWCHSPAVSDVAPVSVKPVERPLESHAPSLQPNARLASASIFNPPKA